MCPILKCKHPHTHTQRFLQLSKHVSARGWQHPYSTVSKQNVYSAPTHRTGTSTTPSKPLQHECTMSAPLVRSRESAFLDESCTVEPPPYKAVHARSDNPGGFFGPHSVTDRSSTLSKGKSSLITRSATKVQRDPEPGL